MSNCYFEKAGDEAEGPIQKPQPYYRTLLASFKPDYILQHLDYNSFKIVLRTWVQIWSSVVIIMASRSASWFGNSRYLFQIIGFIAVSGGSPIIVSIYSTLLCALYVCFGWSIAVVATAISWRIRGMPHELDFILEVLTDGSCTRDNIELCLPAQIFSGRWLKTRTSVVHAVALIIGIVAMGLSQRIHFTLRIPYICGTIVLCISICYHAYIPYFAPLLVSVDVVKTILLAFVLRIICSVLIFPETAAFAYFRGLIGLLKKLNATASNNLRFFETMKPSDLTYDNYKNYATEIGSVRSGVVSLELLAALSKYEISYGRLGPGAIGEIRSSFKNLITSFSSFEFFYYFVDSRQSLSHGESMSNPRKLSMSVQPGAHHFKIFGTINESYKPVGDFENTKRMDLIRNRLTQESSYLTLDELDNICDLMKPFFAPFLKANIEGVDVIIKWITAANQYRTYSIFQKGHAAAQLEASKSLEKHLGQLKAQLDTLGNSNLFKDYFSEKTKSEDILLSLISQCSLLSHFTLLQTRLIVRIMEILTAIDNEVPLPKFFTYFTKSIFENSRYILLSLAFEVPQEAIPSSYTSSSLYRDPDNSPPSNSLHLFGFRVVKAYKLLLHEDLWFWIRSALLTTACAIPFFCRTTAGWFFSNRLIWVVIMCGLSTSEYTGETIYVFFAKLVYSFFGCLIGMVAWYISTGSGSGNYYGYGVVTALLYFYLIYYRHFSKHMTLVPSILYGVTAALVLGTSWVNSQDSTSLANIGYGFKPAYTRFICAVIGLAVGFVASVVPRPKSSKVAIRKILASILGEVGNLYCDVTSFAFQRLANESVHIVARHDPVVERFRLILVKLAGIPKLITPITHEISLVGSWPAVKYQMLQQSITKLIELYQLLHMIFDQIQEPSKWITHIMKRASWYDTDLNADLFAIIHMCSGSLRSKTPLPKLTHATLSVKHLESLKKQWGVGSISLNERFYQKDELHESIKSNLDYDKLLNHDGNLNIVALILCHIIYQQLDQVALITKSLVGEKYELTGDLFKEYKRE